MVLRADDELRHPSTDLPEWRESMWYCFQMPEYEMGGAIYYSYMPNTPKPSASFSVYLTKGWVREPNKLLYQFSKEVSIPDAEWNDLKVDGKLHYKRIDPLKRWNITFDDGDRLALDFPIYPPEKTAMPAGIEKALGRKPAQMLAVHQWLAVYDSEAEVANLEPDMAAIVGLGKDGIIATAPGEKSDYVCRYFAPHAGIPEDPATGSAQCVTVPYWAERLGKAKLTGRQISARVGTFECELKGGRVEIAGRCVAYLEGKIHVD